MLGTSLRWGERACLGISIISSSIVVYRSEVELPVLYQLRIFLVFANF